MLIHLSSLKISREKYLPLSIDSLYVFGKNLQSTRHTLIYFCKYFCYFESRIDSDVDEASCSVAVPNAS